MRWLLFGVPLVALATLAVTGSALWALVALLAAGAAWLGLRTGRVRRRLREVQAALAAFDGPRLHQAADRALAEPDLKPGTRERLLFHRALAFMIEERYAEALRILEQELRSDRLPPRDRLAIAGNRAFCLAQLGRVKDAVALAEQNLRAAGAQGSDVRAVHEGILGVALHLAGVNQAALEHLEEALAEGVGHPAIEAIDAFYLGEVLAALQRHDEAGAAWTRAVSAGANTAFGRRAGDRLATLRSP